MDVRHRPQRMPRALEAQQPTTTCPIVDVEARRSPRKRTTSRATTRQSELVRQALLRLPADRREVLVLSRYEYKTYDEIARVLECSVGAVKVRVHRAMKQLREIYLEMTWRGIDMSCEETSTPI